MTKFLFIAVWISTSAFGSCGKWTRELIDWPQWVQGVVQNGFLQKDFDLVLGGRLPTAGTPAHERLRAAIQENFPKAVKSVALEPDHLLVERTAQEEQADLLHRLNNEIAVDWDDTPTVNHWKERYPPRRGLELTLYYLLQPASRMAQWTQEMPTTNAFAKLLAQQKQDFLSDDYYTDGVAILGWANSLRFYLAHLRGSAYLSGSFVGGRSKKGSDLDGMAYLPIDETPTRARQIARTRFRATLSSSLKEFGFQGVIPGLAAMPLSEAMQEHPAFSLPCLFSPWHFWITSREIQIVMYPQPEGLSFNLETGKLNGEWPAPKVYSISFAN